MTQSYRKISKVNINHLTNDLLSEKRVISYISKMPYIMDAEKMPDQKFIKVGVQTHVSEIFSRKISIDASEESDSIVSHIANDVS